jgi:hypothetical protein
MKTRSQTLYLDHAAERDAIQRSGLLSRYDRPMDMLRYLSIDRLREKAAASLYLQTHPSASLGELGQVEVAAQLVPFTAPRARTTTGVVSKPKAKAATTAKPKAATSHVPSMSATAKLVNQAFDRAQMLARMQGSTGAADVISTDVKLTLGVAPSSETMRQHALSLLRSGAPAMQPSDTKAARALAVRMGLQHEGASAGNTSTRLTLG